MVTFLILVGLSFWLFGVFAEASERKKRDAALEVRIKETLDMMNAERKRKDEAMASFRNNKEIYK